MAMSSLLSKIETQIRQSKQNVFMRKDFDALADYDQVGRVLLNLTKKGVLIKIGYGLYAKARLNPLTNKLMLAAEGGFYQVAEEALNRMNVQWSPNTAVKAYQQGSSTQIPANAVIVVNGRFNRKIGMGRFTLKMTKA